MAAVKATVVLVVGLLLLMAGSVSGWIGAMALIVAALLWLSMIVQP